MTTPAEKIDAFVRDVRHQIGVAEDAGAEHDDLCIAFPPSYLTMRAGWPTVTIEGSAEEGTLDRTVAVVPKLWARDRADEAVAECSLAPLDLGAGGGGLWGFSNGLQTKERKR